MMTHESSQESLEELRREVESLKNDNRKLKQIISECMCQECKDKLGCQIRFTF